MKPREFAQSHLKTGDVPPVLLFTGSETYWKDLHIGKIISLVLGDDGANLGLFRLSAPSDGVMSVLDECNAFGFFGGEKVVIYSDVDRLNTDDQKALLTYAKSPNIQTRLVLLTEKLDKRSSLGINKDLKKRTIDYEIQSSRDIQNFIDFKLRELGNLTMDRELYAKLPVMFPHNMRLLSVNLDKMAANAGFQPPLTMTNYRVVNALPPEADPFSLAKAILAHNFTRAVQIFRTALKNQKNVFPLLGILRWQFELCLKGREMLAQGHSRQEIANSCRLFHRDADTFFTFIRSENEVSLAKKHQLIATCDYALKSTGTDPEHLFEMLLFSLCRRS